MTFSCSPDSLQDGLGEIVVLKSTSEREVLVNEFGALARLVIHHFHEMVNHQTGKSTDLIWKNYAFRNGFTDRDFDRNSLQRAR